MYDNFIVMKNWNKLSMRERAAYIQAGIKSGLTNLDDIHKAYNTYAEGGYLDWIDRVKEWRPGIEEDIESDDPTYDYEGFFNEDPEYAWAMLEGDSEAHFTDKYKRPNHPTFSEESIYSSPETPGGKWLKTNEGNWVYKPAVTTEEATRNTLEYLADSGEGYVGEGGIRYSRTNRNGLHLYASDETVRDQRDYSDVPTISALLKHIDMPESDTPPINGEIRVLPNGNVVDSNGNLVKDFKLPYTVDDEGNYHVNEPNFPVVSSGHKDFTRSLADTAYSAGRWIEDNVLMNKNNVRTSNMSDVDQRQFFNISPRKVASALDAAATFVPHPLVRGVMQVPDTAYDIYDYIQDPTVGNFMSILYDAAGYVPGSVTSQLLKSTYTTPNVNIPIPRTSNSITIPSMTISGAWPVAGIHIGNLLGLKEDIEHIAGEELLTREPVVDPDTIRVQTEPFSVDYISGNQRRYGGRVKKFSGEEAHSQSLQGDGGIDDIVFQYYNPYTQETYNELPSDQVVLNDYEQKKATTLPEVEVIGRRPKPLNWFTRTFKYFGAPKYGREEYPTLKEALFNAYDKGLREDDNIIWDNRAYKVALNSDDLEEYLNRGKQDALQTLTKWNGTSTVPKREAYMKALEEALKSKGYTFDEVPDYELNYEHYLKDIYAQVKGHDNNYDFDVEGDSPLHDYFRDPVSALNHLVRSHQMEALRALNEFEYDGTENELSKEGIDVKMGKGVNVKVPKHIIDMVVANSGNYEDAMTLLGIPMKEFRFGQGKVEIDDKTNSSQKLPEDEGFLRRIYNNHGYEVGGPAYDNLGWVFRQAYKEVHPGESLSSAAVNGALADIRELKETEPEVYKSMVLRLRQDIGNFMDIYKGHMKEPGNFFEDALYRFKNKLYNPGDTEYNKRVTNLIKVMKESDELTNYVKEKFKEKAKQAS